MREHYVVIADRGHLRIYVERNSPGQRAPALDQVEALDFPQGKKGYTDRETDMAGRFAWMDENGDGVLSREELQAGRMQR